MSPVPGLKLCPVCGFKLPVRTVRCPRCHYRRRTENGPLALLFAAVALVGFAPLLVMAYGTGVGLLFLGPARMDFYPLALALIWAALAGAFLVILFRLRNEGEKSEPKRMPKKRRKKA